MSLICGQTISVPKTHDIKYCYENHLSKYDQYKELQGDELQDFKSAPNKQQYMLTKVHKDYEATVKLARWLQNHSQKILCFSESEFIKAMPCLHH
jgi:hypothetical protein